MKALAVLVWMLAPAIGIAGTQPPIDASLPVAAAPAPTLEGAWQGVLAVGPTRLRLVVNITRTGAGWTGTLVSVDQGAQGVPIDVVKVDGDRVRLALGKIGASYDARLAGDQLTGTFTQSGAVLPLELERTTNPPVAKPRPQNPRRPFPYDEIEVGVDNPSAGPRLACTLTEPRGKGPFPGVVLFTGSGPQDRDESLMGHKPFLVLSDAITRRGVAVLRCDDRGIGKSTGTFAGATTLEFASDALAAVAALRARPEIARAHVGLAGHSEGGAVAAIAAARSKDVAFIVLLAGAALPGDQILDLQRAWLEKETGATDAQVAESKAIWDRVYAIIKAEKDDGVAKKKLRAIYDGLPSSVRADLEQGGFDAAVKQVLSPWFRAFLSLDPRTFLAQVRVPVLAINGELDRQVPAGANLPEMKKALAHDNDVTIRELPGLNHLFQTAKTGSPNEYASIDETMAPSMLALVSDWIARHGK
jgi:pimeloyl-ACP methyl ester carboxylesterase